MSQPPLFVCQVATRTVNVKKMTVELKAPWAAAPSVLALQRLELLRDPP